MSKKEIIKLAKEAGMPRGWYSGPWFDDEGQLQTGIPPCLLEFVRLIEMRNQRVTA